MSLINSVRDLFFTSDKDEAIFIENFSQPIVLDRLFEYLQNIIEEKGTREILISQYESLKNLPSIKREIGVIKLYVSHEEFITQNKIPIVEKEYNVQELQDAVKKIINISELSRAFQLIFLPDQEKTLTLFELAVPLVGFYMLKALGHSAWVTMLTNVTRGTVLEGTEIVNETIVFPQKIVKDLAVLPLRELTQVISAFYLSLYNQAKLTLGKAQANEPFSKLFNFVKVTYPYEVLAILLDLLPKELFENERVEIKSRQEVERIIVEKTAQLADAKKLLEQKFTEVQSQNKKLEDIQKSMLNLLEDIQSEKTKAIEEKARDDALLSSIGDGMIATDKEGKIILVNEPTEELLGWNKKELNDKYLVNIIPITNEGGDVIQDSKNPTMSSITSGKKITTNAMSSETFYYTRKDKTTFPVIITATPVNANNNLIGTITIFRDATKEKEVDRMKTEFISLASHQLRTPLSAIRWFSEMLLEGDAGQLTPEQHDFAKNINDSTQRLIDLVTGLLNISRIESGRIMVSPEPTDLKKLVEDLVMELQVKIQEKDHKLIISVYDNLPKVNVDANLIRQVYLNLLTNAIKYTPKGVAITVFISKKNDEILTQVSDNGYGIPKSQQGKIFQKFFRAENIVKLEPDGTGLGLYLIKAIVESSNGKLWFESHTKEEELSGEKTGTTFFFSLPISGMPEKKGEVTIE